jgi:hypothetical protein
LAKNSTQISKTSVQTKYKSGPLRLHKSIATGESLSSAQSEERVGGSKTDKSNKTNK